VLNHEPPLANEVDANVPAALADIAAKALAKNPELRYRSARAFARDLRHWLDDNTVNSSDGDVAVVGAGRVKRRWIAAGVIGAAVIGGLVWAGMSSKPVAPAPAAVATAASASAAPPVPELPSASSPAGEAAATTISAMASAPAMPADTAALIGAATPESTSASAAAAENAPIPTVVLKRPAAATKAAPKEAPKETPKERRAREAREARASTAPTPAAPVTRGVLRIAISPWGEVEVDGKAMGTSPPLTELSLPEGRHQIVIRNTDLPPHNAVVNVTADQPVTLKHKF